MIDGLKENNSKEKHLFFEMILKCKDIFFCDSIWNLLRYEISIQHHTKINIVYQTAS